MLPAEDISHFKPNIAFPQMILEVKICSRSFPLQSIGHYMLMFVIVTNMLIKLNVIIPNSKPPTE